MSEKKDRRDPLEGYLLETEPEKKYRSYAWSTAIGLQEVDGLKTSEYLTETARQHIEGAITIDQAQQRIDDYYKESISRTEERTEEADKVSARITAVLSEKAFVFSPAQYLSIHKRLFTGIYDHAGRIRDYNISKNEWVLDGDSVTYGGALDLRETLEYDIDQESRFSYRGLGTDETIKHLARFIANLWQIHVFGEGNTRTTAVFFIKYLRTLGFDVTNEIFANNAWYFRNALVRANYTDLQKGVHETTKFLELFLRNLLLGETHRLSNRTMHIRGTIADDPINDPINEPIKIGEREQKLLLLIKTDPELSIKNLAKRLSCSESTVKRTLKNLTEKGQVKREGARKNGKWVVLP